MPSWLPSVPYPAPGQHGFWEPVTSTLQWCEEDYYLTIYSAEIMNTLTNLMFWYCAWKGINSCRRNGHDTVFQVAYYGYFLVGFGSFMFHSTLKYPWQLVDELNMIYTTCLMLYASLSFRRSVTFSACLAGGFVAFCIGITLYYHYAQDPIFHQVVYAILTIWLVVRSAWLMETSLRPRWRGSKGTLSESEERDLHLLKRVWLLVAWGVTVFLSGFALWNVDNAFCSTLRRCRRDIGMPWGFLLEGHAWWHLFTGYGAYCYIVWGIHLRYLLDGRQDEFDLVWPHLWSLPEIVKKTEISAERQPLINDEVLPPTSMNAHSEGLVNRHVKNA